MSDTETNTLRCELCENHDLTEDDYVGCCRDGACPRGLDRMCVECATWNDETEEWMCPDCAKLWDTVKDAKETIEILRELVGRVAEQRTGRGDEYDEALTHIYRLINMFEQIVLRWRA